jgi:hypothetical protein
VLEGFNVMNNLPTAEAFLTDFVKDIVANPGHRPELIKGYARHMELREEAVIEAKLGELNA